MKKIWIIGGMGYIGSHLVGKIMQNFIVKYPSIHLMATDKSVTHWGKYEHYVFNPDIDDPVIVNETDSILDPEVLNGISEFDVIYLLAANSNVVDGNEKPYDLINNNVGLVMNVLNLIRAGKIRAKKLVFTSSAAVYESEYPGVDDSLTDLGLYSWTHMDEHSDLASAKHASTYGFSKIIGEKMVEAFSRQYGLDYVILRLANVAGESAPLSENHIPETHLIPCLLDDEKPMKIWNDGENQRDYIYVMDVVDALIAAGEKDIDSGAYNIGTGKGTWTKDLVKLIRPDLKNIEYTPEVRKGDSFKTILDSRKFQNATGWHPRFNLQDIIDSYWSHKHVV
jgi:UDP-glucose 4-epimerase